MSMRAIAHGTLAAWSVALTGAGAGAGQAATLPACTGAWGYFEVVPMDGYLKSCETRRSGVYHVKAIGGRGGDAMTQYQVVATGGRGAVIDDNFLIPAGTILRIIVAQHGQSGRGYSKWNHGGGGGGATGTDAGGSGYDGGDATALYPDLGSGTVPGAGGKRPTGGGHHQRLRHVGRLAALVHRRLVRQRIGLLGAHALSASASPWHGR
jgi:hypothetical protein